MINTNVSMIFILLYFYGLWIPKNREKGKSYIDLLINGDVLLIHSLISVKLWPCCTKLKQGNKLLESDHNLTKMGE